MSLEKIGQKLKQARETQGMSVRNIYERTKIPLNHLNAIETGAIDDLPEPVYVAGFIRRYADFVGLDGQSLSDEYRHYADELAGIKGNNKNEVPVYVTPQYIGKARLDKAPPTFKTIYFNILWIVIIIGLISWLSMNQINNQLNQQDPSLQSLRDVAGKYNQQNTAGQQTTNPQQIDPTGQNQIPPQTDAKIGLSATQHVWLEVKALSSGQDLFTGYLEPGDKRDFQDSQGLRVRAGNGGSLSIDYLGKIETFGQPGKVTERTFQVPQNDSSTQVTTSDSDSSNKPKTSNTTTTTSSWQSSGSTSKPKTTTTVKKPKRLDSLTSPGYIPGESFGGGTKTIDVPYRYSEGRLDSD